MREDQELPDVGGGAFVFSLMLRAVEQDEPGHERERGR